MTSDNDSSQGSIPITDARKSKKHKKRKHKKKHHHRDRDRRPYDSDADADVTSSHHQHEEKVENTSSRERSKDSEGRKKKRKERESSSRTRRKSDGRSRSKRRDSNSSSDSESSRSSSDRGEDRDRHRSRSSRKHKRKHSSHRTDKDKRRRDRDRDRKSKSTHAHASSTSTSTSVPSKYESLLPELHDLLSRHPGLATELPYLLIRMSSGSSINLSLVSDPSVATGFRQIFQTLGCTCTGTGTKDEWKFDDGGRIKHNSVGGGEDSSKNDLVLIKLVRYLMDAQGFTMDAVQDFENGTRKRNTGELQSADSTNDNTHTSTTRTSTSKINEAKPPPPDVCSEIGSLTTMLLEKFQSQQKDKKSSLAKELYDILHMIMEKELICLDAVPDQSLRQSMEKLFMIIGLSKEEMEGESDDEEGGDGDGDGDSDGDGDGDGQEVSFGYVMPKETEAQFGRIQMKLDAAVTACKATHQQFIQRISAKRTLGPSLPPPDASNSVSAFDLQGDDSDDDDDVGPAPRGEEMAKRRKMKGPVLSSTALKQMVKEREAQMIHATTGVDPSASADGAREEWMMVPGEHDFLKGVMSKGIQNRTFKNEKGKAVLETSSDAPLDPAIQKQVDSIIKMHEEARGPSLFEQHRIKKAEEKVAAKKEKGDNWTWNKESDLDSGRRVDKNHLKMVLGGASTDLKNKFQGTYTKSFT